MEKLQKNNRLLCAFPFQGSKMFFYKLKSVEEAFQPFGEVIAFDTRTNFFTKNKSSFVSRMHGFLTRKNSLIKKLDIHLTQQRIFKYCKEKEITHFLTNSRESFIDKNFLKSLKSLGVITIHHHPDNYDHFDFCLNLAPSYDFFFHFDSLAVKDLQKEGFENVFHIPFGANLYFNEDEIIQECEKNKELYQCDIAFCGNYYEERGELLEGLVDLDLKIFGPAIWEETPLKSKYQNIYLDNDKQLLALYKTAKIVINLHYCGTGDGINYRFWEVASVGGFSLVDKQQEIENFFEVGRGKEVDTFDGVSDLREKVKYYLNNDDQRTEMAERLKDKVKESFTDSDFLKKMFKQVFEKV